MSAQPLHPSLVEAPALLEAWGVGPLLGARSPVTGSINATLLITAPDGAYALRAYLRANATAIAREHTLIAHATRRGVPAVAPLPLPDGTTVLHRGGWSYALFPQALGVQVARDALCSREAIAMGQALAELHLALADAPAQLGRPLSFACDRADTFARMAALRERAAGDPLLLRHLDGQRAYLERAAVRADTLNDLPHQVLHGDYTEANLFFANGAICAIIDWENSSLAPRAWEVLRVLHIVFDFELARCRDFVIGYRQRQPLPLDELDRVAAAYGAMRAHDLWLPTAILDGNLRLRRFLYHVGFQPVSPRWAALRARLS